MSSMKPVLCVVTSHPVRGDSGEPTGFAMVELTHPLQVFSDAGIPFQIVSIRGGHPPIDFFDLSDASNRWFWTNSSLRSALANSLILKDLNPDDYSAIFFAGGHGTMWDFPDTEAVKRFIRAMWESGKVVSAVCHGPAALVNATLSDGSYLVSGILRKAIAALAADNPAQIIMTIRNPNANPC